MDCSSRSPSTILGQNKYSNGHRSTAARRSNEIEEGYEIRHSVTAIAYWQWFRQLAKAQETIKVGILHSLSGTMAISETTLKDTVLMMIDEQNKKGGLLGKKLEAGRRRSGVELAALRRKGAGIAGKRQGRSGIRLLDVRVAENPCCPFSKRTMACSFIPCSTKGRSPRRTLSTPAQRQTSRRFRPSNT